MYPRHRWLCGTLLCGILMATPDALADQTAVRIEAPSSASPGSQITVRVHVTHSGNNFFHFTNWVWLKANDVEIGRWEFNPDARPEDENFTRQVSYRVEGPVTLTAQGNCNVHGSAGAVHANVAVDPAPGPGPDQRPVRAEPTGRSPIGWLVLMLGVANLILCAFQVASGRRWIKVKIAVHRRFGQLLLALALIHGLLALLTT